MTLECRSLAPNSQEIATFDGLNLINPLAYIFYLLFPVGYGTQSPSSITGKAIGGLCALIGVFILTLPVPIVVNSFASYYKNRLWRNEVSCTLLA